MSNINYSKLSKVDELSVRKIILEKWLQSSKEQLESRAMLMLAGAFIEDANNHFAGSVVFYENWLKDIAEEIEKL